MIDIKYFLVQYRNHQFTECAAAACMNPLTTCYYGFNSKTLFKTETLIAIDINICATVQSGGFHVAQSSCGLGGKHWAKSCPLTVGAEAALVQLSWVLKLHTQNILSQLLRKGLSVIMNSCKMITKSEVLVNSFFGHDTKWKVITTTFVTTIAR